MGLLVQKKSVNGWKKLDLIMHSITRQNPSMMLSRLLHPMEWTCILIMYVFSEVSENARIYLCVFLFCFKYVNLLSTCFPISSFQFNVRVNHNTHYVLVLRYVCISWVSNTVSRIGRGVATLVLQV